MGGDADAGAATTRDMLSDDAEIENILNLESIRKWDFELFRLRELAGVYVGFVYMGV